jgi:hypothetical protein
MEYLTYFIKSNTGYVNKSNLYNFFISLIQNRTKEEVKQFQSMMKIYLGLSETQAFKAYLFRKDPKNKILEYMD